jgi:hypothetical protein
MVIDHDHAGVLVTLDRYHTPASVFDDVPFTADGNTAALCVTELSAPHARRLARSNS